jgi:hypothetical protein
MPSARLQRRPHGDVDHFFAWARPFAVRIARNPNQCPMRDAWIVRLSHFLLSK